jgi:hypothetical protein
MVRVLNQLQSHGVQGLFSDGHTSPTACLLCAQLRLSSQTDDMLQIALLAWQTCASVAP